jgi:hypothetical protein
MGRLAVGASGQAMRKSRENGGVPPLTYGGMSEEVAEMATPLLTYLTSQVLEKGYSLRGDDMFSQKLLPGNYYEAVAVAVTRGPDVIVRSYRTLLIKVACGEHGGSTLQKTGR